MIDDQVPVILFTRPRRFGKTLALDMLKTFFEKTKEDTSIYFKDKQIWACGEKYQKMQGAFPVISITFKDAKFSDWASTYAAIKNVIRDEFMRHDELFTSDSLNPVEQDYLSRMQTDELSDVEYTRLLLNLGRMLEKHHQSKVVILIDEYDTPIQQGHSVVCEGICDESSAYQLFGRVLTKIISSKPMTLENEEIGLLIS